VPLGVWDQDGTPSSREFIQRFAGSRYFQIQSHIRDYRGLERAIDLREALVGLVVPVGFEGKIKSGRAVPVQLIVDGSDSNTATIALSYLDALTEQYSQSLAPVRLVPLVEARSRVWYNPDLKSRNFIIPGLIAVIMSVIASLLTSLTVAREWER
jgi:ABC-2 type transport system permease protein